MLYCSCFTASGSRPVAPQELVRMVDFRPIHGCRFNPDVVGSMASVLCPPYDMIDPDLQQTLQQLSPFNAVHLEGGEQPDPADPESSYLEAAGLFRQWLEQGVLKSDDAPRFYLMRHGYTFRGQTRQQLALFGGVAVEEYDTGGVLPHEYTREPAVQDRAKLLQACQAQFSPIMSLYRDARHSLQPVLDLAMSQPPLLEVPGPAVPGTAVGDISLWAIDHAESRRSIQQFFVDKSVFLADGHHRYEAARRHQAVGPSAESSASPRADGFVLMALVEFDDPGLLLLPYHRGVGNLSEAQSHQLCDRLDLFFETESFDLSAGGVEGLVQQVASRGRGRHVLGVVEPQPWGATIRTLREDVDWRQWGSLAVSEAWVLEEQVLKPVMGETAAQQVDYSHDPQWLVDRIDDGELQLAFLLKPFPRDAFEQLVSGGQRLPSKSTFFYPKLPTGLLIHQLDGRL